MKRHHRWVEFIFEGKMNLWRLAALSLTLSLSQRLVNSKRPSFFTQYHSSRSDVKQFQYPNT